MKISTADTTKFTHYDRDGLLCQEMISLKHLLLLNPANSYKIYKSIYEGSAHLGGLSAQWSSNGNAWLTDHPRECPLIVEQFQEHQIPWCHHNAITWHDVVRMTSKASKAWHHWSCVMIGGKTVVFFPKSPAKRQPIMTKIAGNKHWRPRNGLPTRVGGDSKKCLALRVLISWIFRSSVINSLFLVPCPPEIGVCSVPNLAQHKIDFAHRYDREILVSRWMCNNPG
jgi:hypothetical protein